MDKVKEITALIKYLEERLENYPVYAALQQDEIKLALLALREALHNRTAWIKPPSIKASHSEDQTMD